MAASSVLAHRQAVQAGLLWVADGVANEEIAREPSLTGWTHSDTVRRWRGRGDRQGSWASVLTAAGNSGRGAAADSGGVAGGWSTQWTTWTLAVRAGISKETVAKIRADHNLKPGKVATFQLSNDHRFEKERGGRGQFVTEPRRRGRRVRLRREDLLPGPGPDPAVAADESRGRAGTMTVDDKHRGTIDLFAAMNLASATCSPDTGKGMPAPTCCGSSTDVSGERAALASATASVPPGFACAHGSRRPKRSGRRLSRSSAGASTRLQKWGSEVRTHR